MPIELKMIQSALNQLRPIEDVDGGKGSNSFDTKHGDITLYAVGKLSLRYVITNELDNQCNLVNRM